MKLSSFFLNRLSGILLSSMDQLCVVSLWFHLILRRVCSFFYVQYTCSLLTIYTQARPSACFPRYLHTPHTVRDRRHTYATTVVRALQWSKLAWQCLERSNHVVWQRKTTSYEALFYCGEGKIIVQASDSSPLV
jgi:hypothetical protein